jgi:hypothetical protein
MKSIYVALALIFSISLSSFSQNRKLEKAKTSLKDNNATTSSSTNSRNNSRRSSRKSTLDNPIANLFVELVINLTYGIAIESIFERDSEMHFANISEYPYKNDDIGSFTYNPDDFSLSRFNLSNSLVMENKHLYGNDFGIKLNFFKRMDIEADYLQLIEKVNGTADNFSLFSAILNYHRIRTQKFDLWFGVGVMHVGNEVNESGFAYNIGAEWFIKKPISILVNHKGTNINDEEVSKTKLLLKYHIKNYNIISGYQHYTLGSTDINAFSIGFGLSF